jgi:predicted RNA-binding Zn-ribbon protein involved in translation (DUF1610 family)
MPFDSKNPAKSFIHVHVCIRCGSVFRREEFEDQADTSGIYLCPKCGVEGPLNIEILATDSVEEDSKE